MFRFGRFLIKNKRLPMIENFTQSQDETSHRIIRSEKKNRIPLMEPSADVLNTIRMFAHTYLCEDKQKYGRFHKFIMF